MARPKNIPMDVYKDMLASGIKFDENGDVIEDDLTSFLTPETSSDDQDDDQVSEEESDEGSDEDVEDDHGDDSDDEDGDEVDLGVAKPDTKVEVKPKLTPKVEKKTEDDVIAEMRKTQEAMQRRIEELSRSAERPEKDTDTDETDDQSDLRSQFAELKREAEEFRKDRLRRFADNVKSSVDQRNFGATFKEIIASSEWDAYLSSTTLGAAVGALYVNAIEKQDIDSVVSFFDEFAKRYLVSNDKIAEPKAKAKKPSLEDLAVPEKTKTTKPVRSSKYDFEENEYAAKLNLFERGRISHSDFMKFDQAFDKALRAGRVKPSN